jgi:hypothetical protein
VGVKVWDLWKFSVLGSGMVRQKLGTFGNFRLTGPGVAGRAGVEFWMDGTFGFRAGSLSAGFGGVGVVMSFLGI